MGTVDPTFLPNLQLHNHVKDLKLLIGMINEKVGLLEAQILDMVFLAVPRVEQAPWTFQKRMQVDMKSSM